MQDCLHTLLAVTLAALHNFTAPAGEGTNVSMLLASPVPSVNVVVLQCFKSHCCLTLGVLETDEPCKGCVVSLEALLAVEVVAEIV